VPLPAIQKVPLVEQPRELDSKAGRGAISVIMKRRVLLGSLMASLLAAALAASPAGGPSDQSCAGLLSVELPDTTIKSAQEVAAPTFAPAGSAALTNLPAFCRVAAVTRPAINFEVWLPLAGWNGKFQGVGNGANAGSISYAAMATALRRGYATASTDTGHATRNARDAAWAMGHPELMVDFGYRAVHVTAENAKKIVLGFYGRPPAHSYFESCSTGGRQALMEAQRFPEDYDGIIAGDPAANWTHFQAGGHLWIVLALNKDPESYISAGKLKRLNDAVNAACDAIDGIADGVLDDPRKCRFDPQTLACKSGQDSDSCLTAKQVKAVKDIWSGARNSSGDLIYPPYMPGAEAAGGWASYMTGTGPLTGNHWDQSDNVFKYMVFENPRWDFRTFDYDRDVPFADVKLGKMLDAFDPDLTSFERRGGKLILYHGWSDPSISPLNTIDYYERVVTFLQGQDGRQRAQQRVQQFMRLFMVPGMLHCSGGPGPNRFDMLAALEEWREQGLAPERVVASHATNGVTDRTRPLCVFPNVAVYHGHGSTDDAASFACQIPDTAVK
jgi:feruloyl esterase